MIAKYNHRSLYWGIPGVWLHLCSAIALAIESGGGADSIVSGPERLAARFILLVGTVLLVIGFSYYARAKGRSGFWGLFGLIGLIGILALVCLKDITPESAEAKAHPETQIKNSKLAEYSLVLGICSLIGWFLTAIPGLILGILALNKIKKNPQTLKGRRLAIAGIVISGVFCAILLVFIIDIIIPN